MANVKAQLGNTHEYEVENIHLPEFMSDYKLTTRTDDGENFVIYKLTHRYDGENFVITIDYSLC
jgi:hypothetical protein